MINAISIKGFFLENFLFATDERSACERVRKDRFVGMQSAENAEYLAPRSLNQWPRPIDAKHGDVVAVLISVTAEN